MYLVSSSTLVHLKSHLMPQRFFSSRSIRWVWFDERSDKVFRFLRDILPKARCELESRFCCFCYQLFPVFRSEWLRWRLVRGRAQDLVDDVQ